VATIAEGVAPGSAADGPSLLTRLLCCSVDVVRLREALKARTAQAQIDDHEAAVCKGRARYLAAVRNLEIDRDAESAAAAPSAGRLVDGELSQLANSAAQNPEIPSLARAAEVSDEAALTAMTKLAKPTSRP
jgi:hypothetical protein